jgi:hypothetical protein
LIQKEKIQRFLIIISMKNHPNLRWILSGFFAACSSTFAALPVEVAKDEHGGFSVKVAGRPFVSYVVHEANKPFFWPVYGPTGALMVRSFPVQVVEGEKQDHAHHRGITFGHDTVGLEGWTAARKGEQEGQVENARGGGDSWTEQKSYESSLKNPKSEWGGKVRIAGLARIVHKDYKVWKSDANQVEIVEVCEHVDASGARFMTEERHFIFRATDQWRSIDFDQDIIASDGPIRFEDRKDSGLSIRVPSSIAVEAKRGGRIISSDGLVNEEAWGKPAKWCDYHGPVGDDLLGVAMMSHPSTFKFPDRWHVRTYGLFAVNPFGNKVFDKESPETPTLIPAGDRLRLRHRFVFHKGDEKQAGIAGLYEAYAKEAR